MIANPCLTAKTPRRQDAEKATMLMVAAAAAAWIPARRASAVDPVAVLRADERQSLIANP